MVDDDSLEFILNLDSTLNSVPETSPLIQRQKKYSRVTESKMSKDQTDHLLQILEEDQDYFLLYLQNQKSIVDEYFAVRSIDEKNPLLTFRKSQIPSKMYFKKIMETYSSDFNISKARDAGINISYGGLIDEDQD